MADALSRLDLTNNEPYEQMSIEDIAELYADEEDDGPQTYPLSYAEIASEQKEDTTIKRLMRKSPKRYVIQERKFSGTTYQLVTREDKIVLPTSMQRKAVEWYHQILCHPGETQTDFEILRDWVQEMKYVRLGCFTYSHEENTGAFALEDDVPHEVKQARAAEIMDLQSQISWDLNQEKIGKVFKCVIDRKEGQYFIGRTEFDSPDVDNEVLVDASKYYLKTGDFVNLKVIDATEFDLYAEPV